MEAVSAAAAAMVDLNTLSRRELQALCKLNGVRANITNVAMVEALQSLPSVDGIDQVGTTLCLPTPGKSAMKSALRTAAAASVPDQQQQGSPLPRGRRVSVKSPEAIRMDAEEDETKRNLFREIVRTPGVALRSTSRRARATPAPLPTPAAAGTLRRSQRSAARKAAAPVEEVEVSTTRRSTRKAAIPKVMIDFDQEEEGSAPALEEDKVQQVEPKGAMPSDEKCHDPVEEEATELPEEGNSKADEPEQGGEGTAIPEEQKLVSAEESAPLSVMEGSPILGVLSKTAPEPAMKNAENASTEVREVFGNQSPVQEMADEINSVSEDKEVVAVEVPQEEQKVVNAEESAPLSAMDGSPILGVLSKATPEPAMKNVEDDSTEDHEVFGNLSPLLEIAGEIKSASEDKEVVAVEVPEEAVKVDALNSTVEAAAAPNTLVPTAVTEKEVTVDETARQYDLVGERSEEAGLTQESSEVDELDEQQEEGMLKANQTVHEESDETIESAAAPNNNVPAAVTEKEVSVDELLHSDLTDNEAADEYDLNGESSEEADLTEESSEVGDLDDEDEEDMLIADGTLDEESDETIEVSGSIDVNFDSDEEEEHLELLGTGEEDDFSGDLSSEFDNLDNFSDAETESNSSPVSLEGIDAAAAAASSAAKTVESIITEEIAVSSEEDVVSQHVETIVKSLDEATITEVKKEECAEEKKQLKVGTEMSLRKLKSAYKESLIAAKEGKKLTIAATDEGSRMALAELDNNAEC